MSRNAKSGKRTLTSRGAATKRRIVEAAAELIYAKGAERVSLDEVMEATGASRSQLYHYFENKDALVREVIEIQTSRILAANSLHLESLDSFEALRVWRDWMIAANRAEGGVGGCPLGSLANELAARSEEARHQLDQSFAAWGAVIEMGLCRMRERGQIRIGADPKAWLYRVTVNVCNDQHRRRRTAVEIDSKSQMADPALDPERALAFEERKRLVAEGLAKLPERERTAIVLRDIEGLSTAEVAGILGVEEGTVRSQVFSARLKLAKFARRRQ